jgi:hypothetical protein
MGAAWDFVLGDSLLSARVCGMWKCECLLLIVVWYQARLRRTDRPFVIPGRRLEAMPSAVVPRTVRPNE